MSVNLFGMDSTGEVPIAAHHAVGSSFAIRYLSRYTPKVVTKREYADYNHNGIYLDLVFEDAADNALGGYVKGKDDAEFAKNQAHGILGPPTNPLAGITFAVDFDPSGREAATDQYFEGVATVMRRVLSGPYGSYSMCAHAYSRGFRTLFQTYAWSGGRFFQPSQIYQYSNDHVVGGVGCDFDKAFDLNRFWNYRQAPPTDANHYERFDKTIREIPVYSPVWGSPRKVQELATVKLYDKYRKMQTHTKHPHRAELDQLRKDLYWLAHRVYTVAHRNNPPHWGVFWRGWRFQELIKRAQGAKVAV